MRPNVDTKGGTKTPADPAHRPTSNDKWGGLQPRTPKDLNQEQQGYMSRQEVSGEATTSAAYELPMNPSAADPNYRIPKKSSLESNRLSQLVLNISPPAKERTKEVDEQRDQPHKRKKGRSLGQISGTRKKEGRSKK